MKVVMKDLTASLSHSVLAGGSNVQSADFELVPLLAGQYYRVANLAVLIDSVRVVGSQLSYRLDPIVHIVSNSLARQAVAANDFNLSFPCALNHAPCNAAADVSALSLYPFPFSYALF